MVLDPNKCSLRERLRRLSVGDQVGKLLISVKTSGNSLSNALFTSSNITREAEDSGTIRNIVRTITGRSNDSKENTNKMTEDTNTTLKASTKT